MSTHEWPAEDYAIGSYIQATIAENYLASLSLQPSDHVLDLGCGNGAFTKKILAKIPQGMVLGIDTSQNMLKLAQKITVDYPNFSLKKEDVLDINYESQFDCIVSFWCLQWVTDIHKAFENMLRALKPGGKLFTLFPAGDDPYIRGYYEIKKSKKFSSLLNFHPPVDYSRLDHLAKKINDLPFSKLKTESHQHALILPSLETFRNFVNGVAFFQNQVPEEEIKHINQALVDFYDEECQSKYKGEYQLNLTIYQVTGTK